MNSFFAYLSRMKFITRWALMRNSVPENIQEHSHMVAVLAHALGSIRRDVLGQPCDPDRCASVALFHDATEIFTGDLPTPIKYHSPAIRQAYQQVETLAAEKLLGCLPEALRPAYAPMLLAVDEETERIVKAADKLSAYIKCMEELGMGNQDFADAARLTKESLMAMELPEVAWFLEHFEDSFGVTLDRL